MLYADNFPFHVEQKRLFLKKIKLSISSKRHVAK
jgi:hypothetical protein